MSKAPSSHDPESILSDLSNNYFDFEFIQALIQAWDTVEFLYVPGTNSQVPTLISTVLFGAIM